MSERKEMKSRIPKSKEECFALLDQQLSDEDKLFLKQDEDATADVHFTLGIWIRNNWIYRREADEIKKLMEEFVAPNDRFQLGMMCYSRDMASHPIIESYIKYLNYE